MNFGKRDLSWWLHSGEFCIHEMTREIEKLIESRVNTIMCDPQLMLVHQKFGGAVFRRSSVYHGLAKFLVENHVRGKRCFEVGSWNGLTSIVLARHFDEVVSIDIAHNQIKHEIADALGVKNIQFIDIHDNDEKAKVARELKFDFAYLDGDHANDTYSDWDLTKHCGRVLFHECWNFQPPVWDLVHELPQDQVIYGGFGLALWNGNRG